MAESAKYRLSYRTSGILAAIALAVLVTGCSTSMSGLTPAQKQRTAMQAGSAGPLAPPAMIASDELSPLGPQPAALAATASATRASAGIPNLGVAPPASESRVLNPEEKARVIAELEALARSQGAETARTRDALARCRALDGLTPAERAARVADATKC